MEITTEEKAYRNAYQEFYREKNRERINQVNRAKNRTLLKMLTYKCQICGKVLPFIERKHRGKYCEQCKGEVYRKLHNKAALNYYRRKRNGKS